MNTFSRRDFLKLAGIGLVSGAVLSTPGAVEHGVQLFADPQIRFGRNLIKGTAYGVILSSSDEGKTWKEVAKLGEYHAIMQLAQKNKQVYAKLSIGNHDFWLRSADTQKWFTA